MCKGVGAEAGDTVDVGGRPPQPFVATEGATLSLSTLLQEKGLARGGIAAPGRGKKFQKNLLCNLLGSVMLPSLWNLDVGLHLEDNSHAASSDAVGTIGSRSIRQVDTFPAARVVSNSPPAAVAVFLLNPTDNRVGFKRRPCHSLCSSEYPQTSC
jgi:hypothetical protein